MPQDDRAACLLYQLVPKVKLYKIRLLTDRALCPRSVKNRQEPENLLILTRTRTDRHGRRHSVAVPLIPPPDGEKFEGGYHIERNPITGGATLCPPEGKLMP